MHLTSVQIYIMSVPGQINNLRLNMITIAMKDFKRVHGVQIYGISCI